MRPGGSGWGGVHGEAVCLMIHEIFQLGGPNLAAIPRQVVVAWSGTGELGELLEDLRDHRPLLLLRMGGVVLGGAYREDRKRLAGGLWEREIDDVLGGRWVGDVRCSAGDYGQVGGGVHSVFSSVPLESDGFDIALVDAPFPCG